MPCFDLATLYTQLQATEQRGLLDLYDVLFIPARESIPRAPARLASWARAPAWVESNGASSSGGGRPRRRASSTAGSRRIAEAATTSRTSTGATSTSSRARSCPRCSATACWSTTCYRSGIIDLGGATSRTSRSCSSASVSGLGPCPSTSTTAAGSRATTSSGPGTRPGSWGRGGNCVAWLYRYATFRRPGKEACQWLITVRGDTTAFYRRHEGCRNMKKWHGVLSRHSRRRDCRRADRRNVPRQSGAGTELRIDHGASPPAVETQRAL